MNFYFANPWGFLALLGIPLLVLIYYLRRRAKVVTVSTLFLLKRTQRESRAGRRFETSSNALPFWLQVLAVLLITWILVEPRYGNHHVTRQIAVVIDSSASMQPLRESLPEKLRDHLEEIKGDVDHASYIVLDHDPRRPRIYQGDNVEDLMDRLEDWNPTDGALDPTPGLRIARSLVGPGGVVVYLTDHDGPNLPLSSQRLALGQGTANCGFTGVTVEEEDGGFVWSAMIRNYSDSPQTREWTVETLDRKRSEPKSISLAPRRFSMVKGTFPEGATRCLVRLSGDAMPLDDVIPVIVKKPRVAKLKIEGSGEVLELGERMVRGFAHLEKASGPDDAEILLKSIPSGDEPSSTFPQITFYTGVSAPRPAGRLLAEEHPLTTGLNFQALLLPSLEPIKLRADDRTLLWSDDRPVILLRRDPISRVEQLVFAFSLEDSNAAKLPALAVLLHRYCEQIAGETLNAHTGVFETSQLLAEAFPQGVEDEDLSLSQIDLEGRVVEVPLKEGFRVTLRAMSVPGFLALTHQGSALLDAAVQFADTREADLSQATTTTLPDFDAGLAERRTSEDRWWRWMTLGLLGLLIAAWHYLNPKPK